MIVDGVEVLYTMRNGKIVDPNIPMNGLVCYLDTRGKNNTDIYRNTLLDLSGNGNNGTLQNFNFTEKSGYVKSSGLRFDGVDDLVTYTHNLSNGSPRTIYLDFTLGVTPMETGQHAYLPFGLRIHSKNNLVYSAANFAFFLTDTGIGSGRHIMVVTTQGKYLSTKLYYKNAVVDCTPQTFENVDFVDHFKIFEIGEKTIHKAMLYNRVLTEQEIQQLIGG